MMTEEIPTWNSFTPATKWGKSWFTLFHLDGEWPCTPFLSQDQPKLHTLCVERVSFRGSQDAGSVPAQWCCQVIKTKDPPLVPVLDGVWWLCGRRTYPYLYSTWHGRCAPVTVSDHTYVVYGEASSSNQTTRRLRRDLETEQMFQPHDAIWGSNVPEDFKHSSTIGKVTLSLLPWFGVGKVLLRVETLD